MPVNMTAQWVERVKETLSDRDDYFDEKVAGLGLRVSKTGRKVWFVQYRCRGDKKRRRLTLEPYPQMSLKDARERAQAVLLDAGRGEDPASTKQSEKAAPTFETLAMDYLERYAKREKRSWKQDEAMIKKVLLPAWGRRKAHDIQRRDVIRLLDDARERGLTTQVNRILALARKIYNWGIERDEVQFNPCTRVRTGISEKQRDRVLSEEEIRKLWRTFETLGPEVSAMFKLRLLTAQRGGEIASMRWADLDLDNRWWTIPAEVAKNKLSHRVPLSEPVLSLILPLRESNGDQTWVFPSPTRKGQHIANVQKAAGRVQEASGVDFVLHDLRRTAASLMTGMGISRLVVSKILNHAEGGVTRIYDRHSYDNEKRLALDAWASRVLLIVAEVGPGEHEGRVATVLATSGPER